MTSLSLFMNTRQNQNNTRKNQNQLCIRKLPGNLVDSDSHRNDKNQRTDNSENAVNHNRLSRTSLVTSMTIAAVSSIIEDKTRNPAIVKTVELIFPSKNFIALSQPPIFLYDMLQLAEVVLSFSYKRKIQFLGTKKACPHLGTDFFFSFYALET